MKNQNDVSLQRGLPVEIVADSQHVESIAAEAVQLYYYNSGVLTIDAGQIAGVAVIAKLENAGVLDDIGGKIGQYLNTSFAFITGTILTTEVEFPFGEAESGDEATGTGQLAKIVENFDNGEFCIDYRNGTIYGKKATTGVSDTANYKINVSSSDDFGAGIKTIVEEASATITYIGRAIIGSATSDSVWLIQKVDTSSGVVITWGGTGDFDQEWDERAAATYS